MSFIGRPETRLNVFQRARCKKKKDEHVGLSRHKKREHERKQPERECVIEGRQREAFQGLGMMQKVGSWVKEQVFSPDALMTGSKGSPLFEREMGGGVSPPSPPPLAAFWPINCFRHHSSSQKTRPLSITGRTA